jgi:hypothetical protein
MPLELAESAEDFFDFPRYVNNPDQKSAEFDHKGSQ